MITRDDIHGDVCRHRMHNPAVLARHATSNTWPWPLCLQESEFVVDVRPRATGMGTIARLASGRAAAGRGIVHIGGAGAVTPSRAWVAALSTTFVT